ncbi:MAG: type II secretion system protein [Candidatus Omnitrophica bacterium]|nr:type II secretion system protein [Candidatus Omnitrophota bacterium]
MNAIRTKQSGFTMVELLVVLVIIGILAAVATPIFLGNTQKAKASEAVATMSLIRQAQRDYFINNNQYLTSIQDISSTAPAGFDIDTGMTQYFGNSAFRVVNVNQASAPFTQLVGEGQNQQASAPSAQDYVIVANGANSNQCAAAATNGDNCALRQTDVNAFRLEMDNSGRTFVSYDAGASWQRY